MNKNLVRMKPSGPGTPMSETEKNSESKVALLKLGLLLLIVLGIGMLIATAWYMTKRYWH